MKILLMLLLKALRAVLGLSVITIFLFPINATAKITIPWAGSSYFISTRGARVATVLKDIGSNYGVPVIVSPNINDYFIGTIRDESPNTILARFEQLFQLASYYDGKALYIYKAEEVKTEILTPHYLSTAQLLSYLNQNNMMEQRYCSLRSIANFNALEIFGVPMCIERVTELAKNLDEKVLNQAQNEETVQIFPLRFASAGDNVYRYRNQQVNVPGVVSVLREMTKGRTVDSTPVSRNTAIAAGTNTFSTALPAFSADPRQNAVVVRDRKTNIPLYAKLIRELDQKQTQIEISVTIIDVDAGDINTLGIDWSGTAKFGRASIGLNNLSMAAAASTGTISTVLNDTTNFMVQLNALEQHSKARILSRPSVVTLNNVQAILDRNITFYTKLEGDRVAKLESVSAGSLLRVTPRLITTDDGQEQIMLTLNIQDGRQSAPISKTEGLPQIQNAEIATQASLKAGQSLLLGGFVQDELTQGERKIPLLGDIPFIGHLFKSNSDQKRSVVRLFLIKAEPQNTIVADKGLADTQSMMAN